MNYRQKQLVEVELCEALIAFHDIDNKSYQKAISKEYLFEFCQRHHIDPNEALDLATNILKIRQQKSKHNYCKTVESLYLDTDGK